MSLRDLKMRALFRAGVGLALLLALPARAVEPSHWIVWDAGTERLSYGAGPNGDRIPDFSAVGYRGGDEPPPQVPAVLEVEPSGEGQDDTARIQAALDELSTRPIQASGYRGAVQLAPGRFELHGTLRMMASGIVLRGSGPDRTVLVARGEPRTLIVLGVRESAWQRIGPQRRIVDVYVPVGALNVTVDAAEGLTIGDPVIVQRPWTAEWISEIGMDAIPPRADGGRTQQWRPGAGSLADRRITAIRGNVVTLDAPVTTGIALRDGGTLWTYAFPDRLNRVAIENLAADGSDFLSDPEYEQTSRWQSNFLTVGAVQDAWFRGLRMDHFNSSIFLTGGTSRITLTDFQIDNTRKPVRRGARPIGVPIAGQQILVENCSVTGRTVFAWATSSRTPGPNVVHNCRAEGPGVSVEAHQRWASGILFDNVTVTSIIGLGNRGNLGTGHGWAAANSVLWNSSAANLMIESPPGAHNWSFGSTGTVMRRSNRVGEIISPGINVAPESLFRAQLAERLHPRRPANDR